MKQQTILIVDGYNIIGAWPELNHLKSRNEIQAARDLLLFELSNYSKFKGIKTTVVFDAQYVPGVTQTYTEYDIEVVFTQEDETADTYIERIVGQLINPINRVVVATSDAAEQWMIFQQGALRQSANELKLEIEHAKKDIDQYVKRYYQNLQRRRSPWGEEQLIELDKLRHMMNNSNKFHKD